MNTMKNLLLMSILTLTSAFSVAQGQQKQVSYDEAWTYLLSKQQVLRNYYRDFFNFKKANADNRDYREFEIIVHLETVASENFERIGATNAALGIYRKICATDQTIVKPIFKEELRFHVEMIDDDIRDVNEDLSYTKLPAVSQTAIHMKEDLRDVRMKMEALRVSLE